MCAGRERVEIGRGGKREKGRIMGREIGRGESGRGEREKDNERERERERGEREREGEKIGRGERALT